MTTLSHDACLHIESLIEPSAEASNAAPLLQLSHWRARAGVHLITGPSGSGKTKLLQLLAKEKAPLSHSSIQASLISLPEQTVIRWTEENWRSQVFFVDAGSAQWDHTIVRDWFNTTTPHDAKQTPSNALQEQEKPNPFIQESTLTRTREALIDAFSLGPHIEKPLYMLSTGSRRKAFLLAALLSPRRLVLLDEPLAGLDKASIHALWYALTVRNRIKNQCVLVASSSSAAELPPLGWRSVLELAGIRQ